MNFDKLNHEFLNLPVDYLYHLGIDNTLHLEELYRDVKFAVITQTNEDAMIISNTFAKEFYNIEENDFSCTPLYKTERFHFYKVGKAIIISAGIGMPSTLICLNEITKLFVHAKIYDPIFIYLSAADGLNCPIGSLVLNDKILNSKFEDKFTSVECGIEYYYPTHLDTELNNAIYNYGVNYTDYIILNGSSIGAYDFYDEQARLDGFLELNYTKEEHDAYLNNCKDIGVKSLNMESLAFAGFCNQLEIRGSIVSAIINDRFICDKVLIDIVEQNTIIRNAAHLYARFILSYNDQND